MPNLKQTFINWLIGLFIGTLAFSGIYSIFFNYLFNQLGISYAPAFHIFIVVYFMVPVIVIGYLFWHFNIIVPQIKSWLLYKIRKRGKNLRYISGINNRVLMVVFCLTILIVLYWAAMAYLLYYPKEVHFKDLTALVLICLGFALLACLFAAQLMVYYYTKVKTNNTLFTFLFLAEVLALVFLFRFQYYQHTGTLTDQSTETAIFRANNVNDFSLQEVEHLFQQERDTALKKGTPAWNAVDENLKINVQRVYKDSIMKGSVTLGVLLFYLVLLWLLFYYFYGSRRFSNVKSKSAIAISGRFVYIEYAITAILVLSLPLYKVPGKDEIDAKNPFHFYNAVSSVASSVNNTVDNHAVTYHLDNYYDLGGKGTGAGPDNPVDYKKIKAIIDTLLKNNPPKVVDSLMREKFNAFANDYNKDALNNGASITPLKPISIDGKK